jgi:deoxyhypusine synthase
MNDGRRHALRGDRILPDGITGDLKVSELIDGAFLAYNGGKLQRACELTASRILQDDVTVGLSMAGALTPAGIGRSCIIPWIQNGFVDWIVSTGANLYHDAHFGLGLAVHRGSELADDVALRRESIIRIYDVLIDFESLLETDAFMRTILEQPEFQRNMGTAELHYLLGKYLAAREEELEVENTCVLSVAYRCGVPCYVSSPGDSSIGLNVAELALREKGPRIDVSLDVNETAGIVWDAKAGGGKCAAIMLGGGSPKNFLLQTEPQIQEVLGIEEWGQDYYLQVTDARPDTGGLSGATPAEAVSWGKVDPRQLPNAITVYCDSTIAAPLLTAYCLERCKPRTLRRLYDRRGEIHERLRKEFLANYPRSIDERKLSRPEY